MAEFTERGFEAARMEDVARRAGISKAGVYLYFESKEALLKALIERKIAPLAQQGRTLAAAGAEDPASALRSLARIAAARLSDPETFAVPRLVMTVAPRFPDIAEYHRTHVVEVVRSIVEALIAAGIAKGVFRKVDPRAAARAIIGPLLFEALWTHVLRGESALTDPEKLIEAQFDLLLDGLAERAP